VCIVRTISRVEPHAPRATAIAIRSLEQWSELKVHIFRGKHQNCRVVASLGLGAGARRACRARRPFHLTPAYANRAASGRTDRPRNGGRQTREPASPPSASHGYGGGPRERLAGWSPASLSEHIYDDAMEIWRSVGRNRSEKTAFSDVARPRETRIAPLLGRRKARGLKAGLEPCNARPVGVCMESEPRVQNSSSG
jgi:hypothetical protein